MNLKNWTKTAVTALLLVPVLGSYAADDGWVNMSGSFDGWRQIGNANWRIENGEFVADTGNGHLVTQEALTDFQVKLEFFVSDGKANSGIFFRASNPDAIADTSAYEANIFDERPDQTGRTGGIVHFGAPSQNINAGGQWNTYDITADGDHIVVLLNGVKTVDIHDATYKSGPLSLQYGAGTVKFRNVQIRKL